MRKLTNKEKYKQLIKEYKEWEKDFIKDCPVYSEFYKPKRDGSITIIKNVENPKLCERMIFDKYVFQSMERINGEWWDHITRKRFTQEILDQVENIISAIKNGITKEAKEYIYYHYEYKEYNERLKEDHKQIGNVTTEDLNKEIYFINKKNAEKKALELKEIYEIKERYVKCAYCQKAVKKEDAVYRDLIYPGRDSWGKRTVCRDRRLYCPGGCAGYDQMAHEG